MMLAFEGAEAPEEVLTMLRERSVGGFTLFRPLNVKSPAQVRMLTDTLQAAAARAKRPPLLIAADQEGGQLVDLGERTTQFPGNMALGAARDPELARAVGRAIGREMAAMGLNVDYVPDCDVNTNPDNPNVGVRAFGDDPELVAAMTAAMIAGVQSAGVAATAKHFPGSGDADLDPHFGVPTLPHDEERLQCVELRPFRAAVDSDVKLIMTAHVAIRALTGRADLPATLSPHIMGDLLRKTLGFEGLLISDALDMAAISQGAGQIVDVIAAVRAGVDLLLLTADAHVQERIFRGLQLAFARGLILEEDIAASHRRILGLKEWLAAQPRPALEVVGCPEHRQLEDEAARRSVTLLRNRAGMLPLRLPADARILTVMPLPADLTPADTSSYVSPALAQTVRAYHPRTVEVIVPQRPTEDQIAALRSKAAGYDLLILGTTSAHMQPEQAALVRALLDTGVPAVTVAMRTPYDLISYPAADTHLCTYSIQPASLRAAAAAMWGEIPFQGRLPVTIPGLYEFGHRQHT
jgi:beta-N-acetylhexosaminidase